MLRWVPVINDHLNEHIARHQGPQGIFLEPLSHLIHAGGKRFRPLLTIAACELVGGDPRGAVDVACAIEFIHTSSLILDDLPCMDDARSRRGVEPVHRRYGDATAILAALALFNLAHEILASPGPLALERHLFVANAIGANGMIAGQHVDLRLAKAHAAPTSADLRELRLLKTSALIGAAAVVGAYTGGASREQITVIERFGRELGRVFQRVDDNLDAPEDGGASAANLTPRATLVREVEQAVASLRGGFPSPTAARAVLEDLALVAVERLS
jgi:geranylgeranyl diphosphate synthase, type II